MSVMRYMSSDRQSRSAGAPASAGKSSALASSDAMKSYSSAPTSPARESPASSPAKVGAGAKSAAEPAPLAEVSDSASESDDDDDADSAAAEAPKPLQLGISGRDLVTHAKPVLPLAEAGGVLLVFDACFLVSIGAAARQAHRDRDGRAADQVLP